MVDVIVPLIILLGALFLVLWTLGVRRLAALEAKHVASTRAYDVQGIVHEQKIGDLYARTSEANRDVLALSNKVADLELELRPTVVLSVHDRRTIEP